MARSKATPNVTIRGCRYCVEVDEPEALDMASGYVPLHVRGQFLALLRFADDDRRRADRPARPVRTPRPGKAQS
jgi:hypothetical protein